MAIVHREPRRPFTGLLPPDAEYRDADDIHRAAKKKRVQTCPFDIERFITLHNIVVCREEMADNDISGYIECRAGGQWVIGINKYHNPRRQRFTLAHEFAHFCLDRPAARDHKIIDAILFRDSRNDECEQRANELASNILMPDDSFRSVITTTGDISEIAARFDVSPAAVRYKAYRLRIIRKY